MPHKLLREAMVAATLLAPVACATTQKVQTAEKTRTAIAHVSRMSDGDFQAMLDKDPMALQLRAMGALWAEVSQRLPWLPKRPANSQDIDCDDSENKIMSEFVSGADGTYEIWLHKGIRGCGEYQGPLLGILFRKTRGQDDKEQRGFNFYFMGGGRSVPMGSGLSYEKAVRLTNAFIALSENYTVTLAQLGEEYDRCHELSIAARNRRDDKEDRRMEHAMLAASAKRAEVHQGYISQVEALFGNP